MRNIARNHHYVSQFYLREFLDLNLPGEGLHVIDKIDRRHFVSTPRRVAWERDFNRIDIPGQPIDEAEKLFAEIEGEVAPVLKGIKENSTLPQKTDMETLIYFVALLYIHNPQVRNSIANSETTVIKQVMRALFFRPERYESYRQQEKTTGKELPEYETMKGFVESEDYDIRYGHGHHLRYELESINSVVALLSQRKWSLFIAGGSVSDFVCSDHPVALISIGDPSENPDHPYNIGGPGLAQRNTELTVPLNRRMALFATFEIPSYIGKVSEKMIANVNVRTMSSAARQIYCSNLDFKFLGNGTIKSGRDLVDS